MAKCVVIGGGLAGISSAVFLSQNNHKVILLEASPKLGGKAYSFKDKATKDIIDNGQHILMGAYKNTFELLKILGTDNLPFYQKNLSVTYANKGGENFLLEAPHSFYPFNLLQALLKYSLLNFRERIGIIKVISKIILITDKKISSKTVLEWLNENNQTKKSIKSFWELLVVSTLNTPIKEASALIFITVLRKVFLNGNKSSTIVLPKSGLRELFCNPAEKYLKENGVEVSSSEKVITIEVKNGKILLIKTYKREITDFDYVISAIPFYSMQKIFPQLSFLKSLTENIETSPIITIHLWLEENIFDKKFYGLINSKIHWVYNNKNHISIVISAAEDLIKLGSNEVFKICMEELNKYFPKTKKVKVLSYKVLKEKRATFKSTPLSERIRMQIESPYNNLLLAGDWTNTKLPATIEGAIQSGKSVSEMIL